MSVLGMSWKGRPQEIATAEPIRRPKRRSKPWKLTTGRLMLLTLLGCAAIEALLGVRLWAQLTAQSLETRPLPLVFDVTEFLVSPFQGYEPSSPIKETGILEIATLIAMQVYLIAAIALLFLIAILGAAISFFFAPRREFPVRAPLDEPGADTVASLKEVLPSS